MIAGFEAAGTAVATFGATAATDAAALFGATLPAGVASAIGTGLEGAATGALLGTGEAALTHEPLWEGALGGAVTGGAIGGFGPAIGAATGLGTTAGDVLAGGAGGALGAELTHQNPLEGAAFGALAGGVTGFTTPSGGGGAAPAGGPSAAPGGLSPSVSAPPPASVATGADVGGVPSAIAAPTVDATLTQPSFPTLTGGTGTVALSSPSDITAPTSAASAQLPGDVGTGAAGATNVGVPSTLSLTSGTVGAGGDVGAAGPADLSSVAGPVPFDTTASVPSATAAPTVTGPVSAFDPGITLNAPAAGAASTGGVGGFLKEAAPFLPLAGLALDALNKPKTPYSGILGSEAGALSQQGAQLRGYLENGTLPPGEQEALNAQAAGADASIASEYASRGMTASSAEAQDQQAVQERKVAAQAQIATQLFAQGVQETNAGDQLYVQLMQEQINQDNQLNQAFGNFATALAGMGRAVTPNA